MLVTTDFVQNPLKPPSELGTSTMVIIRRELWVKKMEKGSIQNWSHWCDVFLLSESGQLVTKLPKRGWPNVDLLMLNVYPFFVCVFGSILNSLSSVLWKLFICKVCDPIVPSRHLWLLHLFPPVGRIVVSYLVGLFRLSVQSFDISRLFEICACVCKMRNQL